MIHKFLSKIKNLFFPKPIIEYRYNSYSQVGEDAIVAFLFADKKIEQITYLDLGANIPDFSNNTYLFYQRGYRGVLVEADITLIPTIQKVRSEDKIIHAGISTSLEEEADFFVFNEKGLNTFDPKEAESRSNMEGYSIVQTVKVPLVSINKVIENNFEKFPDFLSIDIEGLDLDVLKSLNFEKFPIPVICVESCVFSENHKRPKDRSIIEFMLSQDYQIYADTYVNTIFVNKTWFNN